MTSLPASSTPDTRPPPPVQTAAEKYAEAESKSKPPGATISTTESAFGDGPAPQPSLNYGDNVTLKLNFEEDTSSILRSKVTIPAKVDKDQEPKENKLKKLSRLTSCLCVPCGKCTKHPHGILKGIRKSVPSKTHLVQYFRKMINNRIDKMKNAIIIDENPDLNISYKVLDETSNALAYFIRERKFSKGFVNLNPDGHLIIAVALPICYEYMILLLTVLKLGAAILPINPTLPVERLAEIIKLTRPILLIAAEESDPVLDQVFKLVEFDQLHVGYLWDVLYQEGWLEKSGQTFKNPIISYDPKITYPPMWKRPVVVCVIPSDTQDLQAVVYDSKAFFNRMKWEDYVFVFITSEHCLVPPGFDTIDSLADVITQLMVGITLVVTRSSLDYYVPDTLFMYCEKYKVRRLSLWPALLKACMITLRLFEEFVPMVSTCRYWFCCGGCIRSDLADMFFELPIHPLAQLINMYHFEDCLGALSFQVFESFGPSSVEGFHSRLPVGCPVPNTDIYLLDSNLNPVKDGEVGEIFVCGHQTPRVTKIANLPNNYYMSNPFSKRKDKQLFLRTYDYGRIKTKSNGARVLVHELTRDRHYYVDNQIVWLMHLDMYLNRLTTLVSKSHTICYRPNEEDQTILAFCILASNKVVPLEVEEELKLCLPSLAIPEVINVKDIPKTSVEADSPPDENALLKIYQERRNRRHKFDGWDHLGITDQFQLRAAKILAYVIYTVMGTPIKEIVGHLWSHPFLRMNRATATKATFIVRELHRNRYPIYNDEFIYAESLKAIPEILVEARRSRGFLNKNCPPDEIFFIKNRYQLAIMVNNNRYGVCTLLGRCFTQRDQLDYFAEVEYSNMRKFFDSVWPIFVQKRLSLIIRKKKDRDRLVGAVLNMNWHDEILLTKSLVPKEIAYKLELIHYLESSLTDSHFPQDKTHVLQICYIGLDSTTLTWHEIHGLTDKIIRSMLIIAKVKGFETLVVITYDYFSMDICVNNYNFNVAKECQVNQFVAQDGTRPYALCPDSMYATLCWKPLHKIQEADKHKRNEKYGPLPTPPAPPPPATPGPDPHKKAPSPPQKAGDGPEVNVTLPPAASPAPPQPSTPTGQQLAMHRSSQPNISPPLTSQPQPPPPPALQNNRSNQEPTKASPPPPSQEATKNTAPPRTSTAAPPSSSGQSGQKNIGKKN